MDLERLLHSPVSRRQEIGIGVKVAVIGSLTGKIPFEAPGLYKLRQELNQLETEQQSRGIPWSNPRWWPLDFTTAQDNKIPRLYNGRNGPLDIYDQIMGTSAREYEEAIVNRIFNPDPEDPEDESFVKFKAENPGMEKWLGHCDVVAALGMLFPQPVGSRNFDQVTKEGLLVAAVKGNIAALEIPPLISVPDAAQKKGAVIDLYEVGRWFRVAYAYDPRTSLVTVTNFGAVSRQVSLSAIRWAHVPYVDIEGKNPAREEYLTPLAYLKNKEVDLGKVIEMVYHK